jgi:hypothetical protein
MVDLSPCFLVSKPPLSLRLSAIFLKAPRIHIGDVEVDFCFPLQMLCTGGYKIDWKEGVRGTIELQDMGGVDKSDNIANEAGDLLSGIRLHLMVGASSEKGRMDPRKDFEEGWDLALDQAV